MLAIRKQRLFFPFFGLLKTRRQLGDRWTELVDWVETLDRTDAHVIGFRLTLDRIRRSAGLPRTGCRDTFCATCTHEIVELFDGSEDQLLAFYYDNVREVEQTMQHMKMRTRGRKDIPAAA
jgi:hypothetical protein